MKVRINGHEVEGTPEEIRQLLGSPQDVPVYPYQVQPYVVPVYPPYIVYGTSTTGIVAGTTTGTANCN